MLTWWEALLVGFGVFGFVSWVVGIAVRVLFGDPRIAHLEREISGLHARLDDRDD